MAISPTTRWTSRPRKLSSLRFSTPPATGHSRTHNPEPRRPERSEHPDRASVSRQAAISPPRSETLNGDGLYEQQAENAGDCRRYGSGTSSVAMAQVCPAGTAWNGATCAAAPGVVYAPSNPVSGAATGAAAGAATGAAVGG